MKGGIRVGVEIEIGNEENENEKEAKITQLCKALSSGGKEEVLIQL